MAWIRYSTRDMAVTFSYSLSQWVQANSLVAALTRKLGAVGSLPKDPSAAIQRSIFVPRTAQPPCSHLQKSTELDQLGLTVLRATVDLEPHGSNYMGGDP